MRRGCDKDLDIRASTTERSTWEASGVFGYGPTCYRFLAILCIRKLGSSAAEGLEPKEIDRDIEVGCCGPLPGPFEDNECADGDAASSLLKVFDLFSRRCRRYRTLIRIPSTHDFILTGRPYSASTDTLASRYRYHIAHFLSKYQHVKLPATYTATHSTTIPFSHSPADRNSLDNGPTR